jgi:hypothetical protein
LPSFILADAISRGERRIQVEENHTQCRSPVCAASSPTHAPSSYVYKLSLRCTEEQTEWKTCTPIADSCGI